MNYLKEVKNFLEIIKITGSAYTYKVFKKNNKNNNSKDTNK